MFAGKLSIAKVCKIHFRTLQIVYNNYDKSQHDLLNFSNDVSIYQKHSQFLAIGVYKSLININPEFLWEFFNKNPVQYNLRKGDIFYLLPARYTYQSINSLAFRGRLLWKSLPSNVKQNHNLEEFKLKLRSLGNIYIYRVLCVVGTNPMTSFYCLCYVSLMLHLYYVFYLLSFSNNKQINNKEIHSLRCRAKYMLKLQQGDD